MIETGLVSEIREILSPVVVAQMSEDDMEAIVGEKDAIRTARKTLQAKLKLLNEGAQTCRKFSGFNVLGKYTTNVHFKPQLPHGKLNGGPLDILSRDRW